MPLIRIARRSRRQVLAGLLAYAVTRGHVSYATTRIDKYQRGARIRRRSIPFVMPISSPHPPSSFSFFLSTCHSLHCAVILLMFHFPFMCVPRLRARSTSTTGACSPERAPLPGPGTCDATTVTGEARYAWRGSQCYQFYVAVFIMLPGLETAGGPPKLWGAYQSTTRPDTWLLADRWRGMSCELYTLGSH
jgi:hypothetical protein